MLKMLENMIFPCAAKLNAACEEHSEQVQETLKALREHPAAIAACAVGFCGPKKRPLARSR